MTAATQERNLDVDLPEGFTADELKRRRVASRRLAWALGALALAIYLAGFLYYRQ